MTFPASKWLSTWNRDTGAGFYAGGFGPLPFAFGQTPPECVLIYTVKTASN